MLVEVLNKLSPLYEGLRADVALVGFVLDVGQRMSPHHLDSECAVAALQTPVYRNISWILTA